jgi:hypothetical protein
LTTGAHFLTGGPQDSHFHADSLAS